MTAKSKTAVRKAKAYDTSVNGQEDLLWGILRTLTKNAQFALSNTDYHDILQAIRLKDVRFVVDTLPNIANSFLVTGDTAKAEVVYQLSSFLKKYPFKQGYSEVDRLKATIDTWLSGELMCQTANEKFANLKPEQEPGFLIQARGMIADLLGEHPPIRELIRLGSHGPGGAVGTEGNKVSEFYKYSSDNLTVTPTAWQYAAHAIWDHRQWRRALLRRKQSNVRFNYRNNPVSAKLAVLSESMMCVHGSRFSTVPKDAKKLRPINVEPIMNVYLQKGVGNFIRGKLKTVGIDLDHGQTMNRDLARRGSQNWETPLKSFATIDLSNASDTVSKGIVQSLLPPLWYAYMDDIRSKFVSLPGIKKDWHLNKFSAMGNGFTFELESLVFWAISAAAITCEGKEPVVAVYGDDIIVPCLSSPSVIEALEFCGFAINHDKSFTAGPFRESCGADYHRGFNIRPYYQKKEITDVSNLFVLANTCYVRNNFCSCVSWDSIRISILGRIPNKFSQLTGPHLGSLDTHLFVDTPPSKRGDIVWWTVLPKGYKFGQSVLSGTRQLLPPASTRVKSRIEYGGGTQIVYKTLATKPVDFGGHSWFRFISVLRSGTVSPVVRRDANSVRVVERLCSFYDWRYLPGHTH